MSACTVRSPLRSRGGRCHFHFPFGDGSTEPVYLTNACCEATPHAGPWLLDKFGLKGGEIDGEFFPLTAEELKYVYDDAADVADGFGALLGYSAIYRGKKYLMPSVELYFGEGGNVTAEAALAYGKAYSEELKGRLAGIGGHVFLEEEHDEDRHLIQVLVPFEYAMSNAKDFDTWKAHLEDVLLRSDLSVEVEEAPAP